MFLQWFEAIDRSGNREMLQRCKWKTEKNEPEQNRDDFYSVSIEPAINKLVDFVEKSTKLINKNYTDKIRIDFGMFLIFSMLKFIKIG